MLYLPLMGFPPSVLKESPSLRTGLMSLGEGRFVSTCKAPSRVHTGGSKTSRICPLSITSRFDPDSRFFGRPKEFFGEFFCNSLEKPPCGTTGDCEGILGAAQLWATWAVPGGSRCGHQGQVAEAASTK